MSMFLHGNNSMFISSFFKSLTVNIVFCCLPLNCTRYYVVLKHCGVTTHAKSHNSVISTKFKYLYPVGAYLLFNIFIPLPRPKYVGQKFSIDKRSVKKLWKKK